MRKSLILAITLLSCIPTFGQTFNVTSGFSYSKLFIMGNEQFESTEYSEGLSLFAGLDYFDKKYFNLSSNIGFIRKGSVGKIGITDAAIPWNAIKTPVLDYLSLNSQVDFKYPISEKFYPFLSVGPRFDYLITDLNDSQNNNIEYVGDINSYSIGLITGCGVKLNLNKYVLGLRMDYYFNFNTITKSTPDDRVNGNLNDKTLSLGLIFGYKL